MLCLNSVQLFWREHIPHEEVKRNHTYASDIYAFALVCYEASYILQFR